MLLAELGYFCMQKFISAYDENALVQNMFIRVFLHRIHIWFSWKMQKNRKMNNFGNFC